MKKDINLLVVIGAAIALALTIAAARRMLPALPAFNPLESWSTRRCVAAFVIVLAATLLSAATIVWSDDGLPCNDKGLPCKSATLEWVYSSDKAAEIVADYGNQRGQAVRGVVLDSIAFIPSYVLLIAITSFWVSHGWSTGPWAAWVVAAGWSAAIAGAFDYLENAGIYAALGGVTTRLAPLTYAACQLKWLLAFAATFFAIFAAVGRAAGR